MEDIEEDKIANRILEGLPPSFMVFGSKKELDPLEEFWMNKLTNIERQYDEHIVGLERKLLNDRAQRRSIKKQSKKIAGLEEELDEKSVNVQALKTKTSSLSRTLKEKEYEAKSMHDKLEKVDLATKNVLRRITDERQTRKQIEKDCSELRNRLRVLEREKAQLQLDVEIKHSEKARVEDREANLHKDRWSLVKNLTEVDAERRIQTNTNYKLCQDIEKLLNVEKSLEVGLLKERQVMGDMMEEMKEQRKQHEEALRQLDIAIKQKQEAQEDLDYSFQTSKDSERRVNHWKEELHFKQLESSSQTKEIKDLKRRNSKIRCVLADTKHKLNTCLSEKQSLENEKRRADVELQSAKRHEKALQLEIRKNELRKFKLAERILKAHPFLMNKSKSGKATLSTAEEQFSSRNEIESYKKKIWKLERHKDDVERKLRDFQRKENIYRMKLDKYSGIEKQIFWTGKAMAKLEGDRNRMEELLKAMESNMPMKVPFKKLVTDPSVLDRLAKNKILQRRIFEQAGKIQELKSNAKRILKFREEQFGTGDMPHEEIPVWKLSYWQRTQTRPENVYSGLNIDIMAHPRTGSLTSQSFTEKEYYKNYMVYLNEEIPKVKDELNFLEKKKLHAELEREDDDHEKRKLQAEQKKQMMFSGLLADDEKPTSEPEGEGENDNDQVTPEVSIHGSSFDQGNLDEDHAKQEEDKKSPKFQMQAARGRSSSTEDERDDVSSDAASEIPFDNKSSEQ